MLSGVVDPQIRVCWFYRSLNCGVSVNFRQRLNLRRSGSRSQLDRRFPELFIDASAVVLYRREPLDVNYLSLFCTYLCKILFINQEGN